MQGRGDIYTRVLIRKPEEKRPFARHGHTSEDN
jgi:hypothetical protein